MKTEQDILNLWSPLPGEYGEYFSIHESAVAGVQADRFILWKNGEKKFEARTPIECGSYPRWTSSGIFWNDNRLDPESNNVYNLGIMKKDFFENPVMPDPTLKVSSGYKPVTFAWSVNSDFFLISVEGFDTERISHSRLLLLDQDGSLKNILWDGKDFAPKAICINSEYIIAGTRDTMIFKTDGKRAGILPGDLISQRIHLSEDGKLLLIQNYLSITLWETGSWKRKGIIKGPWLNAALSPDGKMIYAIDFRGNLNAALVSDHSETIKPVPAPGPMTTIDAGKEYIVGSFAHGAPVRWARKMDLDNSIIKFSDQTI
jgi:hypothetical protein